LRSLLGSLDTAFPIAIIEAQSQVRPLVDLTTNRDRIEQGIDSLESSGGPTNRINDAVIGALVALLDAGTPRAAVVVITDGVDVGSGAGDAQLERAAHLAGIPLYVIAADNVDGYKGNAATQASALRADNPLRGAIVDLADRLERLYYQRRERWRALAVESGGGFFESGNEGDDAYRALASRLNSTYTLYYYSPASTAASDADEPGDADSVPVDVRVDRPGARVHAPAALWRTGDGTD
jgi:hypothetical protein